MARLRSQADMQWATIQAALEAYLGSTAADFGAGVLELTYGSALGICDDYCNNPFTDDATPPADIATPPEVKLGVFAMTQSMLSIGEGMGADKIKTGDLDVSFRTPTMAAKEVRVTYLHSWRITPGF